MTEAMESTFYCEYSLVPVLKIHRHTVFARISYEIPLYTVNSEPIRSDGVEVFAPGDYRDVFT